VPVAKPNWGHKRICQACGKSFYDLCRTPIVCPSCQAVFNPEAVSKARRAKAPATAAPKPPPPPVENEETEGVRVASDEVPEEAKELTDFEEEDASGEEEELIEDASELGEDDMAEVIEYVNNGKDGDKP
jgi:uncharacterized protein (TIGR02300 family)